MAVAFESLPETRSARQELISWWDQDRLESARIVVAGAGAVGNEVLKLLALLGVGNVVVVDFDRVSVSNLSRTVLFRPDDVGQSKALVAADRARSLNSDMKITAIDGDVGRDVGLGVIRDSHIVLGCLDSINARWAINRRCWLAGVPWINAGISATEVQVTRYVPGVGACYECTFSPGMIRRFNERYSCTGLVRREPDQAVATTAIGASIAAAIQVDDAIRYLHDPQSGLRPGHRVTMLLDSHRQFVDELPGEESCSAHRTVGEIGLRGLSGPDQETPNSVVARARTVLPTASTLALGFDFVEVFQCPLCNTEQAVCRPAQRVYDDEINCPECGVERVVRQSSEVSEGSLGWTLPLAELGISELELLHVHDENSEKGIWVEIGGQSPW